MLLYNHSTNQLDKRGINKMLNNFAFLDFSTPELVLILAIILLLFGGKKLPQLSKSIGESMRELRKGLGSNQTETNEKAKTKETTAPDDKSA